MSDPLDQPHPDTLVGLPLTTGEAAEAQECAENGNHFLRGQNGMRVVSHRGLQKSLGLAVTGGASKTTAFMGQFECKVDDGKDLAARL